MKHLKYDDHGNQVEAANVAIQNHVSVIDGSSTDSKNASISLITYNLLNNKLSQSKKDRIMICTNSDKSVEQIVKVIYPIVSALGKKFVWIAPPSMDFKSIEEYENAPYQMKALAVYQIMNRDTREACIFRDLLKKS